MHPCIEYVFVKIFFDGKRQELCLCIIEKRNGSVNKKNQTQKPYIARLIQKSAKHHTRQPMGEATLF
jgi:hypothetical protein